jgi:hypothetical protein
MPKKTEVQAQVTYWWLSGEEECAHCGQLYPYELEFRCTECDSPSCPHCRWVHAQGHPVCPSCVDAQES